MPAAAALRWAVPVRMARRAGMGTRRTARISTDRASAMGPAPRRNRPQQRMCLLQPRGSVAEVLELQRLFEVALLQQRHHFLQVIALFAIDAQLVAVDLGIDLDLGLLDPGGDLLGQL